MFATKGMEMPKLLRRTFLCCVPGRSDVLLMTASALAFSCTPVNKPIGAGEGGTATFDLLAGMFTITSEDLNPAGKVEGNFLTVLVVEGDVLLEQIDIFGHEDLPDGAHNSGPGDSECYGVGIDDAAECGP